MIFLILLAVVIGYIILMYNRFVKLFAYCDEGWSGIDVQLKRRYDLIPALVTVVKGYAKHESKTLKDIVLKRNEAKAHLTPNDKSPYENQMIEALKNIFVLVEAYPDLKADKNFRELQNALVDIEDDLQRTRRYYNATVRDYNVAIGTFPALFVARAAGFKSKDFFEIEEIERQAIQVDL